MHSNMFVVFALAFFIINVSEGFKENQCPYQTIREEMIIESPLFEENLIPNYFRCWYNITAPDDKIVEVKFSTFSFPMIRSTEKINYGPIETECVASFVQVTVDQQTLKFCGNELENRRLQSSKSIQILFQHLNVMGLEDDRFKGFKAQINFLDEEKATYCDNTVIIGEEKITVKMPEGSESCQMAVKAPAGKVPEIELAKTQVHTDTDGCEVDMVLDPDVALTSKATDKIISFDCKKSEKAVNKNVNLVPFTLFNEGGDATFDVKFQYRDPTVKICGGDIKMVNETSSIEIDLNPGRYSCMWTYNIKGTPFENQQLIPKVTLDVIDLAEPTQGFCLTNNLAVVVENSAGTEAHRNTNPLMCGQNDVPEMWSNSGTGKDLKIAILFFGTVPAKSKAVVAGEVQLK